MWTLWTWPHLSFEAGIFPLAWVDANAKLPATLEPAPAHYAWEKLSQIPKHKVWWASSEMQNTTLVTCSVAQSHHSIWWSLTHMLSSEQELRRLPRVTSSGRTWNTLTAGPGVLEPALLGGSSLRRKDIRLLIGPTSAVTGNTLCRWEFTGTREIVF